MTFTKFALASLVLGASFGPALAETETFQTPVAAYEASIGRAEAPAVVEGRQATPIAAPATTSATDRYLDGRIQDQDR